MFSDPVGIQTQDLQNRNLTLYSAKLRDPLRSVCKVTNKRAKSKRKIVFLFSSECQQLRQRKAVFLLLRIFLAVWMLFPIFAEEWGYEDIPLKFETTNTNTTTNENHL